MKKKVFAMIGAIGVGMFLSGCQMIALGDEGKAKKPEIKPPQVVNINYYIIVRPETAAGILGYNHKIHHGRIGPGPDETYFSHDHKKQRGHAGQVPDEYFMNADHRKQRGRTAPNKAEDKKDVQVPQNIDGKDPVQKGRKL